MYPTVAEILELPALQAGRPSVRAGRSGLGALVRWVHVSEQRDPAGTMASGVLVLSIGVVAADPSVDPADYLAALRDAGAVALVIELGQHLRTLPDRWLQAARALDFPLVELRRVVRFVEVTEAVHARVVAEQYSRLKFADRVATVFRGLTVERAPAEAIVAQAATLTGLPVVLEDAGHHVLAVSGEHPEEVLRDWIARSRRAPTTDGGPEGWQCVPVGGRGRRWGRLVVPIRLGTDERMVLDHAADAITVSAMLREQPAGPVRETHDRLLADLLAMTDARAGELRARARALGLPEHGPYAVLALLGPADFTPPRRSLVGTLADDVTAVVSAEPIRALPSSTVTGAAEATNFDDLGDALAEARRVALAAAAGPDPTARTPWRAGDLGARGLFWDLRTDPRLMTFVDSELAAILTLPDKRRADLLADAAAFVESDGVVAAFADRIGVSRPSAYARVDRLSAALGRDVRDPMVRFSLRAALLGLAVTNDRP